MKSKAVAIALLALTTILGYSNTSFADTCYDVEGTVTTENVTPTLQMGNISLTLINSSNDELVFSETGSLVGNITGTEEIGTTLLSHIARFPKGNSFVTKDDIAIIIGVRNLVDETPCSFFISETISNIAKGTRFFKNVTSAEVVAEGYISNCPDENGNYFELSGELCVE